MRYNDRNFTNYQEKQRDGIDLEMWERACERKFKYVEQLRVFRKL
jgi:hypothetical protein